MPDTTTNPTKRISVPMPESMRAALAVRAAANDRSLAAEIRVILTTALETQPTQPTP